MASEKKKNTEQELKLALKEKDRELSGLYSLTRLTEQTGDLEELFNGLVKEIIPASMQFPDKTVVIIQFDGKTYNNLNKEPVCTLLSSLIWIKKKKRGFLSVGYSEELPFLESYEQNLIRGYIDILEGFIESKEADKEIKTLKQQIEFILGTTKTGLDIIDSNLNIIYIDPVWEKVYGDPDGKKCYQYFMGRKDVCPNCGILEALETKKPVIRESVLVKENNRPIQVTTIPFQNDKGEWLVAEVNVDITKRKEMEKALFESNVEQQNIAQKLQDELVEKGKAEQEREIYTARLQEKTAELELMNATLEGKEKELEEANKNTEKKVRERTMQLQEAKEKIGDLLKLKTEFVNQLSHDLRTPLSSLTILLPVMKEKIRSSELKTEFDVCIRNTSYLSELIRATLNLGKLEAGKMEMKLKKTDITELIAETVNDNKTLLAKSRILIINHIRKPTHAYIDSLRIKEVFSNIFQNSMQFMPKEGIIEIYAKKESDQLIVSIKDNGKGMSKKTQQYIFDEFYKGDSSRHDLSSFGLGMTICRKIIELHNGRIWAESAGRNKGSTFFFTLPLKKVG